MLAPMPGLALQVDHVQIAVDDLDVAGREFDWRFGLASLEGGRHPGWGTANRIVPLGDTYLELVAVVDETDAAGNPFGRWVAATGGPLKPLGWAVRTNEIEAHAERLGLEVRAGSRVRPDGRVLQWRIAGVELAALEPCLPFFIQWEEGTPFPGRADVRHGAGRVEISELRLDGDAARLQDWLGNHRLPIVVRHGLPAVTAIVLATTTDGEVVVAAER